MLQNRTTVVRPPIKANPIRENIRQSSISHCGTKCRRSLPRTGSSGPAGLRAKHPSLLAGLLFDEKGERLTPTHAVKKGTRYRYYVSAASPYRGGTERSEQQTYTGRQFGTPGDRQASLISRRPGSGPRCHRRNAAADTGQSQLVEHGRQAAEELGTRHRTRSKRILVTLACRVVISSDRLEINLSRCRLAAFLAGQSIDPAIQNQKLDRNSDDIVTLVCPHASSESDAK